MFETGLEFGCCWLVVAVFVLNLELICRRTFGSPPNFADFCTLQVWMVEVVGVFVRLRVVWKLVFSVVLRRLWVAGMLGSVQIPLGAVSSAVSPSFSSWKVVV